MSEKANTHFITSILSFFVLVGALVAVAYFGVARLAVGG